MYHYRPLTPQEVSARTLVLSLMSSEFSAPQPIGRLIDAAALFGIEPATLRVAVTRLIKDGLLESPDRGVYQPGPKSRALTRRVQSWKHVTQRLVSWHGDWLIALTHHLGRTDRKQLRARERALGLTGYQRISSGDWVRPANLAGSLADLHADLTAIGADKDILLLRASDVSMAGGDDWPALWSADALAESYEQAIAAMRNSLARLPDLGRDAAARETLLIGQAVIRTINFDPLLPPELADQKEFLRMVDMMVHYNEVGRKCWQAYYASAQSRADQNLPH